MSNTQMQPQRLSFSQYVNSETGKVLISNAIKDQRKRDAFVTAIISAVSTKPALQECTAPSIISAALQGVALGLAPSPQLGQFYMVPFDCVIKDENGNTVYLLDEKGNHIVDENGKWVAAKEKRAQFVPGYKGYIQLAYRSGQYVDIDAGPVFDGEYKGRDRFTGRPTFEFIEDDTLIERVPVVGYMAHFELVNGARKVLYWSKEKMIAHADRYSPAFSKEATTGRYPKVSFADYQSKNYPQKDEWLYSSFWYKDFDSMACKTMLRQLITKWGPVSIEMESAIIQDAQNEAKGVDYGVDFSATALPAPQEPDVVEDVTDDATEPPEKFDEQFSLSNMGDRST